MGALPGGEVVSQLAGMEAVVIWMAAPLAGPGVGVRDELKLPPVRVVWFGRCSISLTPASKYEGRRA